MQFEFNTENVSADDIALLNKVSAHLAGQVYDSETIEATPTTASTKGSNAATKGKKKDTATSELADAAKPMEENTEPTITLDDLRKVAQPLAEDETNGGNEKFVALIEKHGGTKLSNIPKENYAAMYADLKAFKPKANLLD
jgi:hypothetical protein